MMGRRNFIKNAAGLLVGAPMVVKASSLMTLSSLILPEDDAFDEAMQEMATYGNTMLSVDIFAKEALDSLSNHLNFNKVLGGQVISTQVPIKKQGDTIRIRRVQGWRLEDSD